MYAMVRYMDSDLETLLWLWMVVRFVDCRVTTVTSGLPTGIVAPEACT